MQAKLKRYRLLAPELENSCAFEKWKKCMTTSELKKRIAKGEDLHTEFKSVLPENRSLAKSLVCFANTDGGQFIIGIADSGEISGVTNIDESIRRIDDVAVNRCEPPITVVQETLKIDKKTVLVVNVPKGTQRPYRTASGQYFIRATNKCRQASREEMLRLFQAAKSLFYDETILARATFKDLGLDYFEDFLKLHYGVTPADDEIRNYLENLGLLAGEHPTFAGLLFFGKHPQAFVPTAKIVAAYIRGDDIATPPADKKEITGRIADMIDAAEKFLRLYLQQAHVIDGFKPELRPEVPLDALREAIVNAIAHRDYTISAPIRLLIFDDRVEIRTPGTLPNGVTIPKIRIGGAHMLRNPTIYNLLARMGMVTDLGSGVRRIIKSVKTHLNKEVALEDTGTEFVLTIPRKGI